MNEERKRRIALNEAVFRQVNDRLDELNRGFATITENVDLVCECGDLDCTDRIVMTSDEYEELRSDPTRFAVIPDHVFPDTEDLIEDRGHYQVVEKHFGLPSDVARATDPRDGD